MMLDPSDTIGGDYCARAGPIREHRRNPPKTTLTRSDTIDKNNFECAGPIPRVPTIMLLGPSDAIGGFNFEHAGPKQGHRRNPPKTMLG